MATVLEIELAAEGVSIGGRAPTCRNGRLWVRRVPYPAGTSRRERLDNLNEPDDSRYTDCTTHRRHHQLDGTTPAMTTPFGEPNTATFLQQFTNSVSRALHKQTCSCKGRTYTADELKVKSNPAIFAPDFIELLGRNKDDSLPPVIDGTARRQKQERPMGNHSQPRKKSEYEFEPLRRGAILGKVKKLGESVPKKKRQRTETNLPERLDVIDKSGQNWQIVQELPKQHKKRSGRLKPVVESLTPPNTSRIGHTQPDLSRSQLEVDPVNTDHRHDDPELKSRKVVHIPQAESCRLKVLHFNNDVFSTSCVSSTEYHSTPMTHEANSDTPLLSSAVYDSSHQGASLLPAVSNKDNGHTTEHPEQPGQASQQRYFMEEVRANLPSLNTDNTAKTKFNQSSVDAKTLPLELQELYKRGGLKVSTLSIDVGGILPANFLHQDKNKLRQMYPMFDWRVGCEAREPRGKHCADSATNATKEVTAAAQSTFELPANFPVSQEGFPREKSKFMGRGGKRHKKVARKEKVGAGERPVGAANEGIEGSGEAAAAVEQVGVAENAAAVEMRPISGSFPKQPPPTPMNCRRNRTVEAQA